MDTVSQPTDSFTVVWIDYTQARIFVRSAGKQTKTVIPSLHQGRTPSRSAVRHGGDNNRYLDAVLAVLPTDRDILLIGPDNAKKELADYLKQNSASLAERLRGVETSNATSDGQLLARARAYFLESRPGNA